jgi:hypothetical protein
MHVVRQRHSQDQRCPVVYRSTQQLHRPGITCCSSSVSVLAGGLTVKVNVKANVKVNVKVNVNDSAMA